MISESTRDGLAPEPSPRGRAVSRPGSPFGRPSFRRQGKAEIQLHEHPGAQAEPLPCIAARIWSVPSGGAFVPRPGAGCLREGARSKHSGSAPGQLPLETRPAPRRCRTRGGRPRSWCRSARPGRRAPAGPRRGRTVRGVDQMGEVAAQARSSFQTTSTSPFRKGAQAAVESRPVVADAGGEVVVDVGFRRTLAGCATFRAQTPKRRISPPPANNPLDANLDPDPFDIFDGDVVCRAVVELRGYAGSRARRSPVLARVCRH